VFDRKSGLATEHFTRVVRDPAGVLWFATFDGGLVTRADGAWRALGREDNLPAGAIVDLALDPRGNPWIVTRTGEVAHHVQGVWARLELPRPASAAADTARAADALGRLDPAIRFMSDAGRGAESSAPGSGYCLGFDRTGNCLVGAPAGVYRLGTSGWQLLELPGAWKGRRATAVLGAANGDVMLGTAGGGVLVWRNGDWSRIAASSGLSDNYIRALREDRGGAIWIGTQYGGVTKYTPPPAR
jgi:ligand-binding sensor domain-containing protein